MHRRALIVVIAVTPVLQGAGCRAHYSARLQGDVVIEGELEDCVMGTEIRVIYRTRDASTNTCTDNWGPCLSAPGWKVLKACNSAEPGKGQSPTVKIRTEKASGSFDGCTDMIGVDYQADIAVFVDSNGDGVPSWLESYGVFRGNPLTRDAEATALPMVVEINRRMPDVAD